MTAAERYAQLEGSRTPYLTRARECAKLTIPSLMPEEGTSGSSDLPTPYQGMGARGVNNLAAKLLLALLPPSAPFFRLSIDDFALAEIAGDRPEARSEVEKTLGDIERTVMTEIEATAIRVSAFEALKQLLNAGNVLLYLPPTGGMKVFRLDRYVVKRDPMGNILEIVVKEEVSPAALPEELRKKLKDRIKSKGVNDQKTVKLFTYVRREGDKMLMHQEVEGEIVPGTKGSVPVDKSPWIALRWAKIDGEDYGRGHVEEYIGDLRSLEGLTEAIVEGSAAAAKVLFLVDPNSTTQASVIAESKNLDVRTGNADDVTVLQVDKLGDFRVALQTIEMITARLAQAFLLMESVQRDAERVTAEEVRRVSSELDDALGGVYSILSQEFQHPLVRRVMYRMQEDNRLPQLPEDMVRPTIITGVEALGRGHDLNRLMMFGRVISDSLGPEAFTAAIRAEDFIKRVGTNLGIDMDGLVKSREELQADQQNSQMQALIQNLGPELVKQMGQGGGVPSQ
ncbi:phage tail protein [Pyruvatibacter mobilis]|uniref:Phage tail protein n=1 Tax=Pyruvatibacter mobilis TaxID=1712261 RepID=A0A845Q7S9_9HYPH|nr:portal protein [Pyruvatibacter mobilis]NBG94494.1 phage tail protein [Pyruvatibacter mobilis]QJD74014.1 phage tail protein [Pyruvatibacter mobilis]GGD03376.1 hypothetical protein GCM10011587_03890 [Pyruvatibacter mobilis]